MAINTWTNGAASRVWETGANWSLGHKPAAAEDVVIGGPSPPLSGPTAAVTVKSLDASGIVGAWAPSDGLVNLTISGGPLKLGSLTTSDANEAGAAAWNGDATLSTAGSALYGVTPGASSGGNVSNALLSGTFNFTGGMILNNCSFAGSVTTNGTNFQGTMVWGSSGGIDDSAQPLQINGVALTVNVDMTITLGGVGASITFESPVVANNGAKLTIDYGGGNVATFPASDSGGGGTSKSLSILGVGID